MLYPITALLPTGALLFPALLLATSPPPSESANECQALYAWATGMTTSNSQNQFLDAGKSVTLNRTSALFVENKKQHQIKIKVTVPTGGEKFVTLDAGARDPLMGNYVGNVTLISIECLQTQGNTGPSFPTPASMISALKSQGVAVGQVVTQVAQTFNTGGQALTQLMKDAGYTAEQVAGPIRTQFNAAGGQMAQWLVTSGFFPNETAAALRSVYNATGAQVGQWLKSAGLTAPQIAGALQHAFQVGGAQVAIWLKDLGYSAAEATAALKQAFAAADTAIAEWIKAAGYSAIEFGDAAVKALGAAPRKTIELMYAAGYGAGEAMTALYERSGTKGAQLVEYGVAAGYQLWQIANNDPELHRKLHVSLQELQGLSRTQGKERIGGIMRFLGYDAEASRDVLLTQFKPARDELRQLLRGAGFPEVQVNRAFVKFPDVHGHSTPFGFAPIPYPNIAQQFPLSPGENKLTLHGVGLTLVTAVEGLPTGTSVTISNKTNEYMHVLIIVPETVRAGAAGMARLMIGSEEGPQFPWVVQGAR